MTSMSPPLPSRQSNPMLDPCVTVLLRPGGTVQLGWDPETAHVITPPAGVDAATFAGLLRLLDGEHSRPQVMWRAAEHGVQIADMSTVLAELDSAGLIIDPSMRDTATRTIRIHGRGPLADAIAKGLGLTGCRVTRSGATGEVDISRWQTDFVVLTDDLVADPKLIVDLVRASIPHLQVRIRDGKGLVGPLVVPGRTSCLRCAELTRCGYDSEWPHLAAQMLGRVGYGSPATVLATAALALAQLERVLAGRAAREAPASLDATLELDIATSTLNIRRWSRHALCECWQSSLT